MALCSDDVESFVEAAVWFSIVAHPSLLPSKAVCRFWNLLLAGGDGTEERSLGPELHGCEAIGQYSFGLKTL